MLDLIVKYLLLLNKMIKLFINFILIINKNIFGKNFNI